MRTEGSRPVEIVPRVYGLGSEIVNWYLVEDDGRLVAVDSGVPGFRTGLDGELGALDRSVGDVEAVVLTHSDADHIGLAATFQEAGARVLIHAGDEDTLRRPRPKGGDASPIHLVPELRRPQLWRTMIHLARRGAARPSGVDGAELFGDGDVLEVAGRPRVVPTPGHTPGHCAFLFEGHGALFAGDALCTWNPLTGRTGAQVMPSALNVDTDRCFASLAALEELDAAVLLPGHGEPWRQSPTAAVAAARGAGRS